MYVFVAGPPNANICWVERQLREAGISGVTVVNHTGLGMIHGYETYQMLCRHKFDMVWWSMNAERSTKKAVNQWAHFGGLEWCIGYGSTLRPDQIDGLPSLVADLKAGRLLPRGIWPRADQVLVFEDRDENVAAAKVAIESVGMEAIFASSVDEVNATLSAGFKGYALIDVYCSAEEELAIESFAALRGIVHCQVYPREMYSSVIKSLRVIEGDLSQEAPVGLLVGELMARASVPFLLTTSLNHHAVKAEAVMAYACLHGWDYAEGWKGGHINRPGCTSLYGMADDPRRNKDRPEFWAAALAKLRSQC